MFQGSNKTFMETLVCAQLGDNDQLLRKLNTQMHTGCGVVLTQHSVVHTIGSKYQLWKSIEVRAISVLSLTSSCLLSLVQAPSQE